jgi:hypothetical protein
VTGCTLGNDFLSQLGGGLLGAAVAPSCEAPDSTVINPTSIKVTANPEFFSVLGIPILAPLVGTLLQETVHYTVACNVDGGTVSQNESFTAKADTASQSQTVNLQDAVGSPVPNSCKVENLRATSLLSISGAIITALQNAGILGSLSFGVQATANTAVSGAVYSAAGHTSSGLTGNICADDAGNGNANAHIQVFQCNSDLAQYWVQASTGQLVRNGDCMAQSGSVVKLENCTSSSSQVWDVRGTGGTFDTIVNASSGQCLTWPAAVEFTQLTATNCTGSAGQKWTGPSMSAFYPLGSSRRSPKTEYRFPPRPGRRRGRIVFPGLERPR